jgi:hypothetical protein
VRPATLCHMVGAAGASHTCRAARRRPICRDTGALERLHTTSTRATPRLHPVHMEVVEVVSAYGHRCAASEDRQTCPCTAAGAQDTCIKGAGLTTSNTRSRAAPLRVNTSPPTHVSEAYIIITRGVRKSTLEASPDLAMLKQAHPIGPQHVRNARLDRVSVTRVVRTRAGTVHTPKQRVGGVNTSRNTHNSGLVLGSPPSYGIGCMNRHSAGPESPDSRIQVLQPPGFDVKNGCIR